MKITVQKIDSDEGSRLKCVRKWPSKTAREWCESFVSEASSQSNIDAIVAVGSAIRDVSEIADIDLVVIYSHSKPNFNNLPIDVDIRVYERKKVQKLLSKGHDLLGWSIKLGCVVYERNLYWTKLRSHWINRLPLPSIEQAMARAARTKKLYLNLCAVGDKDAAAEQFVSMLTHLARARLIEAGVFPASRRELEEQLRSIGEKDLAEKLTDALNRRW